MLPTFESSCLVRTQRINVFEKKTELGNRYMWMHVNTAFSSGNGNNWWNVIHMTLGGLCMSGECMTNDIW